MNKQVLITAALNISKAKIKILSSQLLFAEAFFVFFFFVGGMRKLLSGDFLQVGAEPSTTGMIPL